MTSTHSKITWHIGKPHKTSKDQQQTTETDLRRLAVLELSDADYKINYDYI